jgi:hypothetical protein
MGEVGRKAMMIFPPSKLTSEDRASYPKSWDLASLSRNHFQRILAKGAMKNGRKPVQV